jgi:hypothetical protein
MSDAKSLWRLNFVRRLLISVGPQYRTCFMSHFWRLEFWGGFEVFEKMCAPQVYRHLNAVTTYLTLQWNKKKREITTKAIKAKFCLSATRGSNKLHTFSRWNQVCIQRAVQFSQSAYECWLHVDTKYELNSFTETLTKDLCARTYYLGMRGRRSYWGFCWRGEGSFLVAEDPTGRYRVLEYPHSFP